MSDLLKFADGASIEEELRNMTMSNLMDSVPHILFCRADRKRRDHLLQTISTLAKKDQDTIRATNAIHPQNDLPERSRSPFSTTIEDDTMEVDEEVDSEEVCGNFMRPAGEESVRQCIESFIDATGNSALATVTCMVCARETAENETEERSVTEIQNKQLLVPSNHHSSHKLTKGMLLETSAIKGTEGTMRGSMCLDCTRWIKKRKTPPLALANNMWIGAIPTSLSILTLPEKILVARYFPAAFIVKLFPKQKGAKFWPTSGLHSGMRGNVSTYKLNTDDIADMVNTDIMPPPAKILASTIGVTIIGPKNMPERTMPNFLRVRRDRIRTALLWLKDNNPLYANVQISEASLGELPVNNIPPEILGAIRSSDRTDQLEKERAGYVVNDEDAEDEDEKCEGYVPGLCNYIAMMLSVLAYDFVYTRNKIHRRI